MKMPDPCCHRPVAERLRAAAIPFGLLIGTLPATLPAAGGSLRDLGIEEALGAPLAQITSPLLTDSGGMIYYANGTLYIARSAYSGHEPIVTIGEPALDFNGNLATIMEYFVTPDSKVFLTVRYDGTFQGAADDEALLCYDHGELTQVIRQGDPLPFATDGTKIGPLSGLGVVQTTSGETFISFSELDGSGLGDTRDSAILAWQDNAWVEADSYREGDLWGTGDRAMEFYDRTVNSFHDHPYYMANEAGQIVAPAIFYDPADRDNTEEVGIFLLRPPSQLSAHPEVETVMKIGDTVPNGAGTYAQFLETTFGTLSSYIYLQLALLSEGGDVAFLARLANTPKGNADNEALFLYHDGAVEEVARKTTITPTKNGAISSLASPLISLNRHGMMVFRAVLTGTTGGSTDNVALFQYSDGTLAEILRIGQRTPDDTAKIVSIYETSLNDEGMVGILAEIDPDSSFLNVDAYFVYDAEHGLQEVIREGQAFGDKEVTSFIITSTCKSQLLRRSSMNNAGDIAVGVVFDRKELGIFAWVNNSTARRLVVTNQWEPNAGAFGWLNGAKGREAGWAYSVQLGWVFYPRYPWVYDSEWGWLYFTGRSGENGEYVSFYSPAHGVLTITDEAAVGWFFAWNAKKWDNFLTPKGSL